MANDGTVKIGVDVDEKGFKSSLSKLGGVAKTALAGVTAATGAASAEIGVLAKKSLDAYGNYEQLVGGVETLFKGSASIVEEYANIAYKTAGLSANEYMETVTGFSASLLQSLGGDTAKAADIADQAIIDMADNANKMGSSMESIQNAYQGFAKQNYTMLDNLKLGYGGTKEEMQRLLADAEKISGIHFDISSFSDVVQAIHVVQEDLGIAGTTAEEAASTIQGSLASMGAAWQNLVTGIADENADIDQLIDNFVETVATAADNILPRLEKILSGIGESVTKLAPVIAEKLPELMAALLPPLIQATGTLIQGLAAALPGLLDVISDAVHQALDLLSQSLAQQIPALSGLFENLDKVVTATAEWADSLNLEPIVSGFREFLEAVEPLVDLLLGGLSWAWENILLPLAGWVIEEAAPAALNVLTKAFEGLQKILEALSPVFKALWENVLAPLASFIGSVFVEALNVLARAIEFIGNLLSDLIKTLSDAASKLAEFFGTSNPETKNAVTGAITGIFGKSSSSRAAAPMSLSDEENGGAATFGLSRARAVTALASAIPDAQNRVAIATASMAPSAGRSALFAAGGQGSGGGQTPTIIVQPNVVIKAEGDLAPMARLFKPALDAEDARLGQGV